MNIYGHPRTSFLWRQRGRAQRGIALITVLLVLLILTAIAFGLMYMANTETMINANFRSVQSAFAASQAGVQEVRERLRPANPAPHLIAPPAVLPGPAGSIVYITNPQPGDGVVDPTNAASPFFDDEFCRESFSGMGACPAGPPVGAVTTRASDAPFNGTNAALPYKWVRLTLKANNSAGPNYLVSGSVATLNIVPICWDGSHEFPKPAANITCAAGPAQYSTVMMVTALAMTRSGARRMTQMEVAQDPPFSLPAAVTLDSAGQSQCQIQGNNPPSPIVTGVDQNPNVPPGSGVAGIVINNGSCPIQGAVVAGAAPYNGSPSVYNLPMPPNLQPGANLNATIAALVALADNTFNGNPPAGAYLGNCTAPNYDPKITVINSPGVQVGALVGCGPLVIQAGAQTQLEINGNIQWQGPIIVFSSSGQVQFQMDSGNGRIDGGLLLASSSNAQIQFQYQGNGPAGGINYNSFFLNYSAGKPPRVLAFRELAY